VPEFRPTLNRHLTKSRLNSAQQVCDTLAGTFGVSDSAMRSLVRTCRRHADF
jgi:hypothetical protein